MRKLKCILLCENTDIFSHGPNDLGRTKLVKHKIKTGNARPIKQPPRRLPYSKRTAANQAYNGHRNQGVTNPPQVPGPPRLFSLKRRMEACVFMLITENSITSLSRTLIRYLASTIRLTLSEDHSGSLL